MPMICVVERASLRVAYIYEAEAPTQSIFGGPWGNPVECLHMIAPDGLKRETVRAVRLPLPVDAPEGAEAEIALEADPAKVQEQIDLRWSQLRQERNVRLSASDWTQLADVQMSEEKKLAWAAYRAALRNLPSVTADPFAPEWPMQP